MLNYTKERQILWRKQVKLCSYYYTNMAGRGTDIKLSDSVKERRILLSERKDMTQEE